jgi:hypothetical protein
MKEIFKKRLQVSTFLFQELLIPALKDVDLNSVIVKTGDLVHQIQTTHKPELFKIIFNRRQKAGEIVILKIFSADEPGSVLEIPKPPPETIKAPKEKKKISFFNPLQLLQSKRRELNQAKIDEIRRKDIDHKNLGGLRVLTFDFCGCWARALGMTQKARQLRHQLKIPLYEHFDLITGQGDGAIIAAAVAAGIDFDQLGEWWINDWRKVHSPGPVQKLQRWAVSKIKPNESGFNAKKARRALKKLFSRSKADLRFKDVLTRLQITVTQADMNIHTHYSHEESEMELWAAVEDSAITKLHYNQKNTIKGAAVFLGAIEKNDVMALSLSPENKKMSVISIGTPTRINPPAALKLSRLGHAADKKALQDASHFNYEKRVKQLMKKLHEVGYNIGYSRLECAPLDGVTTNDTSDVAMKAGVNSGSGPIDLKYLAGGRNELARIG